MADDEDICGDDTWLSTDDPDFIPYVFMCIGLVCLGGIMSGLQQGMMQLDKAALLSLQETSLVKNSYVYGWFFSLLVPLTKRKHLTLVTLLVSNAIAMETLPIFMDVLVPKYVAIAMSVSFVVAFGEIIPQALCLRWPGELACTFAGLVWILLAILYPICYPIARLLDYMLGAEHHAIYTRAGLGELVAEQSKMNGHGTLTDDELDIITGTLELHGKIAADICIPLEKVFKVGFDAVLTDKLLRDILDHGHSRVPVWRYKQNNIVGLLLVKHLIRLDPKKQISVGDLQIVPAFVVDSGFSLFALLRRFRTGTSHMAVVTNPLGDQAWTPEVSLNRPRSTTEESSQIALTKLDQSRINTIGIVTLEDVIEELLKHDIEDETDVWRPMNQKLDDRITQVQDLRDGLLQTLGRPPPSSSRAQKGEGIPSPAGGEKAPLIPGNGNTNNDSTAKRENDGSKKRKSHSRKGSKRGTYGSLNEFLEQSGKNGSGNNNNSSSDTSILKILENT